MHDFITHVEKRDPRISRTCLLMGDEDIEVLSVSKYKLYICLDDSGLIIEQHKNTMAEDIAMIRPYDVKKRHVCLWAEFICPPSNISPTKIKEYFFGLADSVIKAVPAFSDVLLRANSGNIELIWPNGISILLVPAFHFKKYWPISALRYLEFYCRQWSLSFQEIINTGFYVVPPKEAEDSVQVDGHWDFDVSKIHKFFNKLPPIKENVGTITDLFNYYITNESPHDFLSELISSVVLRGMTKIREGFPPKMSKGEMTNLFIFNITRILLTSHYKSPFYEKNILASADPNAKKITAEMLFRILNNLIL